jgi:hypothetical protein
MTESFVQQIRDGNVHVVSERFRRSRYRMGGGFSLGHWDFKKKKMVADCTLHWSYRKNDPEWRISELKLKAYWPIIDPWIRKRLIADTLSFDEAPPSAKHARPRA